MFNKLYSTIAKTFGQTRDTRLIESLVSEMMIQPHMWALDLGCGSGGDAALLHEISGASVIGVDFCIEMLYLAGNDTPVVNADIILSPFKSNVFDCIYAINILQLLSDRFSFFKEAKRMLLPGGKLGLPIATPKQIQQRFINQFFPNLLKVEKVRYPPIDILCSELQAAGLNVVSIKTLDLGSSEINEAYVNRLRAGVLSGLLLLGEDEREFGLKRLEEEVIKRTYIKNPIRLNRYRTLIVAKSN